MEEFTLVSFGDREETFEGFPDDEDYGFKSICPRALGTIMSKIKTLRGYLRTMLHVDYDAVFSSLFKESSTVTSRI